MGFWRQVFSKAPVRHGEQLANVFMDELSANQGRKRLGQDKLLKAPMQKLEQAVQQQKRDGQVIGWLARSRCANAFKWRLLDRGLERSEADSLTEWVLLRL